MTPKPEDLTPLNGLNPCTKSLNNGVTGDNGDKPDMLILQDLACDMRNEVMNKTKTTSTDYTNLETSCRPGYPISAIINMLEILQEHQTY